MDVYWYKCSVYNPAYTACYILLASLSAKAVDIEDTYPAKMLLSTDDDMPQVELSCSLGFVKDLV